jgi:hypothetical protein
MYKRLDAAATRRSARLVTQDDLIVLQHRIEMNA